MEFAGEEILVEEGGLDVGLDGIGAAEALGEGVDIDAENAEARGGRTEGAMTGEGNGIAFGGERPGMGSGGSGGEARGVGGGPANVARIIEGRAIESGEILARGGGGGGKGFKQIRAILFEGGGSAAADGEGVVQAFADEAPFAEVLGGGPDEFDAAVAQVGDLAGGGFEEGVGAFAKFGGEDDEELSAAGGSEEDGSEAEILEEGAGQHFAHETDPARASEQRLGLRAAGLQKVFDSEEFSFEEDLNGQTTEFSTGDRGRALKAEGKEEAGRIGGSGRGQSRPSLACGSPTCWVRVC